jgi:O-antigen/teichoic acid export membrane protein
MINTSAVLYLGSRGLAAAGNLLAVAIFTRIAGPSEYGHYVLIFAWSMIVYGFSAQWMRFAYFGVYQTQKVDEYVASLARLIATAMAILALGCTGIALYGSFEPAFLLSIFALVCSMTIYEAAFEVTRTLLNASAAALSMILRTCLIVVLGTATLWYYGTAIGLAFAIALAHLLASIPCLMALSGLRLWASSRTAAILMLKYGWPLLLSFGVTAIGQSIDRLLLAHFAGTAALGPYGVVADLLRQSFSVVGEAIILSLVTVAKQHANEGNIEASNRELRKAFNACLTAAAFGAAFFFVFGDAVVRVLLGPKFVDQSRELTPIFAVAFAFMTMRNFYFAQVIYFTRASHLELVVSFLFVVLSSVLSILLIPSYGAYGAAISLMLAFLISCIAYIIAGRRHYRMPVDLAGLGAITMLAALFVAGAWCIDQVVAHFGVALALKAAVFAILAAVAIRRFGLLRSSPAETGITTVPAIAASPKPLPVLSSISAPPL